MPEPIEFILCDECGLTPNQPVLAGVSGGPDSLCLLDILHRSGYEVVVAHFNHRLRPEADREASSVSGLATSLGLPFETASADVHAHAEREHLSIEEAARVLRYRFLFAAARKHGAQAVAVGHTADDQVETVLMHFLRGAALSGLKGMEFRTWLPSFDRTIPVVRPLLGLWRSDTEAYCRTHGLQPHYDASNLDQAYFRNRVRHTLIPQLEGYQPRFKKSLLRTARALQGDYAVIQEVIEKAWIENVRETGEGWVAFEGIKVRELSDAMQWNLFRRGAMFLRPESGDFGFEALQRASVFAKDLAGKQVDFANGLYLLSEGERLFLAAYEADLPSAHWPQVAGELTLQFPGQLDLGEGWLLSAEEQAGREALEQAVENPDPYRAWLDAEQLLSALGGRGNALMVRPALPGERFEPLGMEGHSLKLSDFFVNVKLPLRARRGWPVVVAGRFPVWVTGYRIAHSYRVTENSKRVVRLVLGKN